MAGQSGIWPPSHADSGIVAHILQLMFENYPGSFLIRLWDDSMLQIGKEAAAFTLALKHVRVPRDLILFRDPVRLAEAYFDGAIEVEGDFNAALGLRYYLENLNLPLRNKLALALRAMSLTAGDRWQSLAFWRDSARPIENNLDSIAFHYDVSNHFYQLWLDERMVYSCAYFEYPEMDLDIAQCAKLDHICRKLRLRSGETMLDVGCGWGALVCWAASHYGVQAHGITLSRNQYEYACNEVRRLGLQDKVTIELRDYRDLPKVATYDKVSSVGMFEHVGLKNLPDYFSTVRSVLKPGGLFLNHGITTDEPGWRQDVSSDFINRHVFPDGELDTVSNIQKYMEGAGFEIFDVEGLRAHYAMTLRHWVNRLEANHEEAAHLAGERTYRIWRLYMTGCAIQFEQGKTGIYQILAAGKEVGLPSLPLTRRDIYSVAQHARI